MRNNYSLRFRKFDIFVVAFATVLIVLSIIFTNMLFQNKGSRTVRIYYQNQQLTEYEYNLDKIDGEMTIVLSKDKYDKLLGDVTIKINSTKGIAITEATCPNHFCTKQGYVHSVGYPVVCVPNGVYVIITTNKIDEDIILG